MLVRFYIRNQDDSIEGDETTPAAEYRTLDRIEKDFKVFGQRKTMVLEFDPSLTPCVGDARINLALRDLVALKEMHDLNPEIDYSDLKAEAWEKAREALADNTP